MWKMWEKFNYTPQKQQRKPLNRFSRNSQLLSSIVWNILYRSLSEGKEKCR